MQVATIVKESRRGHGEDRVTVCNPQDGRVVLVVADGAGGVSGGKVAAELICAVSSMRNYFESTPAAWLVWLDREIAASPSCGLAAAVVVEVRDDGTIIGASVGDCEAWVFGEGSPRSLTARQIRKPLLGDGAVPMSFATGRIHGTLVVGSDGLWKYMSLARIRDTSSIRPLGAMLDVLVDGVKLRSGAFQDDVAVLTCEVGL